MKIDCEVNCDVIKDLLPLYQEGLLSEASVELVEEHLESCVPCQREAEIFIKESHTLTDYRNIKDRGDGDSYRKSEEYENTEGRDNVEDAANTEPQENFMSSSRQGDIETFKKIRKKITLGKVKGILLAVLGSLVMTILIITYLTAPNYLPYNEERVGIIEGSDNKVYLEFGEDVAGYDIEPSGGLSGNNYEYRITTWNTLWNQTFGRPETSMMVLNPEGNRVNTIFYYTTDGQMDQVIYGTNPYPDGGTLTLPRLALNYYVKLAAFCFLISLMFWKLFRKQGIRRFFEVAALFFGSYVLAHGMLHGLSATTYSMLRDFTEIMLLSVTIFMILLVLQKVLVANKKQ